VGRHNILPYQPIPQHHIMYIMVRDITAISMYMVSMVIIITVTIMQVVSKSTRMVLTIPCTSSIQSITDTTWVKR
jgi:hypothetical protein